MVLYLLRGMFILLVASVSTLYLLAFQWEGHKSMPEFVAMMAVPIALALFIVAVDIATPQKRLSAVSGVFVGLLAGLLAAWALSFVVDFVHIVVRPPIDAVALDTLLRGTKVIIGLITCYLAISMVLQTKDDFRLVIPYIEFAKQYRGHRPMLLDSSAAIDGRICEVAATNTLQGTLVVPRFILNELQKVADSSDKLRRARGRRGLDAIQKLQSEATVDVTVDETDLDGDTVDQKLINLACQMRAKLVTGDFNLAKIADVRGVEVVSIHELAKALRPVFLPGEPMTVKIVKPGESADQGVGYHEDGTMVVVENSRSSVGEVVDLVVTSTIQTSAGRMIFGRQVSERSEAALPAPAEIEDAAPASGSPAAMRPPREERAKAARRNPRRR